jgi:hypothetical protein
VGVHVALLLTLTPVGGDGVFGGEGGGDHNSVQCPHWGSNSLDSRLFLAVADHAVPCCPYPAGWRCVLQPQVTFGASKAAPAVRVCTPVTHRGGKLGRGGV